MRTILGSLKGFKDCYVVRVETVGIASELGSDDVGRFSQKQYLCFVFA